MCHGGVSGGVCPILRFVQFEQFVFVNTRGAGGVCPILRFVLFVLFVFVNTRGVEGVCVLFSNSKIRDDRSYLDPCQYELILFFSNICQIETKPFPALLVE